MKRRAALSVALFCLLLTPLAWRDAAAQPPTSAPLSATPAPLSEQEQQQALDTARTFVTRFYQRNVAGAFELVRGIKNPEAEAKLLSDRIHDSIAAEAYQHLSLCEANLETLGGALSAWSRVNGSSLPRTLDALVAGAYLTEVPRCPAGGRYVYQPSKTGVSVACTRDAHRRIGITGSFPALTRSGALTLGGQSLRFERRVPFTVAQWNVNIALWQADYRTLWLALTEQSSLENGPMRDRGGVLVMSRRDGVWKIDLWLTCQDLNMAFDPVKWQTQTPIVIQALCYAVQGQPGTQVPESEQGKPQLQLRVCEANLRGLAVALEDVSLNLNGRYPTTGALETVLKRSRKTLPTCPAGGRYTYRCEPGGHSYVIFCAGHAHADAGLPADLPSVDPVLGVSTAAPTPATPLKK